MNSPPLTNHKVSMRIKADINNATPANPKYNMMSAFS